MDAFTMVILACVAGEPSCISSLVNDRSFISEKACEARIDEIATRMSAEFGKRPELKGKQVTYDVSCMTRAQLWDKLRIAQSET